MRRLGDLAVGDFFQGILADALFVGGVHEMHFGANSTEGGFDILWCFFFIGLDFVSCVELETAKWFVCDWAEKLTSTSWELCGGRNFVAEKKLGHVHLSISSTWKSDTWQATSCRWQEIHLAKTIMRCRKIYRQQCYCSVYY